MHLNLLQTARANHSRLSCVFVMVHIKFDAQILQSVCYLLNLEVRPSINTFFWVWNCSLNVAPAFPRRANEELSVSLWIRWGLTHCRCSACVFMWIFVCTVSVYLPSGSVLAFAWNFITPSAHRTPLIVESGCAHCGRLCAAFLQICGFANRRSDGSMGWVSVVKLFKSSSPLQTETAPVLAFETLLTTGRGPRQTSVAHTRTSWITGCFSGRLIIARPRLSHVNTK